MSPALRIPLSPSFSTSSRLLRVCYSQNAVTDTLGERAHLGSPLLLAPSLGVRSEAPLPQLLAARLEHAHLHLPECSSSRTVGAREWSACICGCTSYERCASRIRRASKVMVIVWPPRGLQAEHKFTVACPCLPIPTETTPDAAAGSFWPTFAAWTSSVPRRGE